METKAVMYLNSGKNPRRMKFVDSVSFPPHMTLCNDNTKGEDLLKKKKKSVLKQFFSLFKIIYNKNGKHKIVYP